jgi:hypothetical protein
LPTPWYLHISLSSPVTDGRRGREREREQKKGREKGINKKRELNGEDAKYL